MDQLTFRPQLTLLKGGRWDDPYCETPLVRAEHMGYLRIVDRDDPTVVWLTEHAFLLYGDMRWHTRERSLVGLPPTPRTGS